jgi:hypothetical protein
MFYNLLCGSGTKICPIERPNLDHAKGRAATPVKPDNAAAMCRRRQSQNARQSFGLRRA